MFKRYNIAVVGAMGLVGSEIIKCLGKSNIPVDQLRPLDIKEHENEILRLDHSKYKVLESKPENFVDIDIAFFAVSKDVSLKLAPIAVSKGALVIDNSVAFRMDPECPLVIPEVNPDDVELHKGIIANPNCSTIQMLVVLKTIHDYANIKRIVVSTYQAVSGSGKIAIDGLLEETKVYLHNEFINCPIVYKYPIAFNCIPQIDIFDEDGFTFEEHKMINETKKILHNNDIEVNPTCVRVPVVYGHSESVNIETEKHITREKAVELLNNAKGVEVVDDINHDIYPHPYDSKYKDITMVGRIREDKTVKNGLNMWIVSNNIRKGAALNAVQIAELAIRKGLI
jgi:aspartate-semialdehyde dehydrogenase